MKKFLFILVLAIAAYFVYQKFFKKKEERAKPVPIAVSKHSDIFNQSMNEVLTQYYAMLDGFVEWDSAVVSTKGAAMQQALNNFKIDELKKDTTIYETALFPWENAKASAGSILSGAGWGEKRRALKDLSENLQILLQTVKYDKEKAYLQECPMAFGEGQAANWLSRTEEVVNPYLGKKDPKYGASMLNCGETKMTIDYTKADSTTN